MLKNILKHIAIGSLATFLTVIILTPFSQNHSTVFAASKDKKEQGVDLNDPKVKAPQILKDAWNERLGVIGISTEPRNEDDQFCKSRLLGSISKESCYASCPNPDKTCRVIQTHKEGNYAELDEDLDCYACAAALSCPDMGLLDWNPGCTAGCNPNPKKKCVTAIPIPGFGPIGGTSVPLPKDPAGNPCYACIDKTDKCKNVWPGSTWSANCGGPLSCNPLTHDCKLVGNHVEGYGCYQCIKKPPKTCKDLGLRTQAECATCPANKPLCGPAFDPLTWGVQRDGNGNQCWDCYAKPPQPPQPPQPWPPKPPKEITCSSYNLGPRAYRNQPCQCPGNELPQNVQLPDGKGGQLDCCVCGPNACYPNLNKEQCDECNAKPDHVCVGITAERGKPACYKCLYRPKKNPPRTCRALERADSCSKAKCEINETCEMVDFNIGTPGRPEYIKCAECIPVNDEPNDCESEYSAGQTCAYCYSKGLGCKTPAHKYRTNPDLYCYTCEDRSCPDYEMGARPGQCDQNPGICPKERPHCIDTDGGCHICRESKGCGDDPTRYSTRNCDGVCEKVNMECVPDLWIEGWEQCYYCEKPEKCEDEEDTYSAADCGGACEERDLVCVPDAWGDQFRDIKCYTCEEPCEDDQYKDVGVCIQDCFQKGKECERVEGSDHGCYHCVEPKNNCRAEELKNKAACEAECREDQTRECRPTVNAPNGEQCYACLSKPEFLCKAANSEYPPGTNCGNTCNELQECKPIPGHDYRCEACRDIPVPDCSESGDSPGVCPQQCEGDKTCVDDGQCWWCENCLDTGYDDAIACEQCESCEADGKHECTSTFLVKGGQSCCRCQEIPPPDCDRGTDPGVCPQQCEGNKTCVDDGECWWCEGCKDIVGKDAIFCSECDECEKDGTHECVSTFIERGESCCRCVKKDTPPPPPKCDPQKGEHAAGTDCGGSCSGDQECKPIAGNDYGCEGCQEKKKKDKCKEKNRDYYNVPNCSGECVGKCVSVIGTPGCYQCQQVYKALCETDEYVEDPTCGGFCKDGVCKRKNPSSACFICERSYEECTKDSQCDDGAFCTGEEACVNNTCTKGVNPCPDGQECNEDTDSCESKTPPPPPKCEDTPGKFSNNKCGGTCDRNQECLPTADAVERRRQNNQQSGGANGGGQNYGLTEGYQYTPTLGIQLNYDFPSTQTRSPLSCYECAPKKIDTCYDKNYGYKADCPGCTEYGGECVKTETDGAGNQCYDCITIEEKSACKELKMTAGRCQPYACDSGQTCLERAIGDRFICHQCANKDQIACPSDFSPMTCAMLSFNELCGFGSTCIEIDGPCAKCVTFDSYCEEPLSNKACPAYCPTGYHCVTIGRNCHYCAKGDDPHGCPNGSSKGSCSEVCGYKTCMPSRANEDCKFCLDLTDQRSECQYGYSPGPCPSECPRSRCVGYDHPELGRCSRCLTPVDMICEDEWMYGTSNCDGDCPPNKCKSAGPMMSMSVGTFQCYYCTDYDDRPMCSYGFKPGSCGLQSECKDHECFGEPGPCYTCRSGACVDPYFPRSGCESCSYKGGKCVPAGSRLGGANGANNFGPSIVIGGGTRERSNSDCYECVYDTESCGKYEQESTCKMCDLTKEVCLPGKVLEVNFEGQQRRFQCFICAPKDEVVIKESESFYYVWYRGDIYIIRKRADGGFDGKKIASQAGGQFLDSMDLGGFNPREAMAFIKADSKGAIQQLKGMAGIPSGLAAIGGSMDLASIAKTLSEGLEKGKKYSDECFGEDFPVAELPQTQPQSKTETDLKSKKKKKKKKKKKGEPESVPAESGSFGKDLNHQIQVDGPIVACGQGGEDGKEKILAVFDGKGRPIEKITKAMLEANPNAVTEAFQKAQKATNMALSMSKMSKEDLFKKAGSTISKKIIEVIKPKAEKESKKKKKKKKKKRKKGEAAESNIVPNDKFYLVPEEERKRLLGVFGSKKEVKKIGLGAPMKFGTSTLGAGGTKEKKFEAKDQWGLPRIGYKPIADTSSAWNLVKGFEKKNVLIAVIDSGLDMNHPDGPTYVWKNKKEIPNNGIDDDKNGYVDDVHGWNFLGYNNDLTDQDGHGTFVAGIIAAKWNNGQGIAGINPGAEIMPIKVANENGEATNFTIMRAIYYAVDNGAEMINLSYGANRDSPMIQGALNYAVTQGVFVVVASGNENRNIENHTPAGENGVFTVGSLDFAGNRSTISNWGPNNGLIGPGEQIMSILATGVTRGLRPSLIKQGYYPQSGTSFSAPMVVATASLLRVQNPRLTSYEIEDILHRTADNMYEEGWDGQSGAGLLNATRALSENVNDKLTVMINETRKNRFKKDITTIDVFGTVRGDLDYFVVEVGKGKNASKFKQVAGPFRDQANADWISRIDKKISLRGSREWIVRIRAKSKSGEEFIGQTLLLLN